MAKKNKQTVSPETQNEAMAMAKKIQKPGQTKEQTKLIAQGIQKGIAEYKKQAKSKQREADKTRKKKTIDSQTTTLENSEPKQTNTPKLPWALLALSWIGFIGFQLLTHSMK